MTAARGSTYAVRGLYGSTVAGFYRRARGYLETAEEPKFHLGCGDLILPGRLNSDAYPRRIGAPQCDEAISVFAYVFTEHMIEHLPQREGESHPGEPPRPSARWPNTNRNSDLNKIMALKQSDHTNTEREYLAWQTAQIPNAIGDSPCFTIKPFVRAWGHAFIYDFDTLKQILERNGLPMSRKYSPGESDVPALRNIERHAEIFPNPAFNLIEMIVVEAAKPAASGHSA